MGNSPRRHRNGESTKANGDWAKWEEFKTQSNWTRAAYAAPADLGAAIACGLPTLGRSGDRAGCGATGKAAEARAALT